MSKSLDEWLSHTERVGDCLEWIRCFNTDGYPRAGVKGNTNLKVHRVVYELYTGQDIKGLVVRHKCDNIRCINPEHLDIGTTLDNVADRVIRGRCYNQITQDEINHILDLRINGLTHKLIGERLGIKIKRVSHILEKKVNPLGG